MCGPKLNHLVGLRGQVESQGVGVGMGQGVEAGKGRPGGGGGENGLGRACNLCKAGGARKHLLGWDGLGYGTSNIRVWAWGLPTSSIRVGYGGKQHAYHPRSQGWVGGQVEFKTSDSGL